jgi:two-component system chemotaxis response regulator CheB
MEAAVAKSETLRVLVVDDDAVFRRVMSKLLRDLPEIEVVGAVEGIAEAKAALRVLAVDAVTLDVELRGASGLELLDWVRREAPHVRVVLVTAGGARNVQTEVDAIFLGAAGFVRKPVGADAFSELRHRLGEQMAPLPRGVGHRQAAPAIIGPARGSSGARSGAIVAAPRELIAVGASTGGPAVLLQLLKRLPSRFDVPIAVVQHMSADHMERFVEHLRAASGREVVSARHGDAVQRGVVYVAPAGRHLVVERVGLGLELRHTYDREVHHCRPAVDPLFRSVAQHVGARAVGVVLSGMGVDAAEGAAAMRGRGAPIVVQDRGTSAVWGMPGAVVAAGAADTVEPADTIADVVSSWTSRSLSS